MNKKLLSIILCGVLFLSGFSASALELTIGGTSAYLEAGAPVTLRAAASLGAASVEFFADGVSLGKGTEVSAGSGIYTLPYTPQTSGFHVISAIETMVQGGRGSADELQVNVVGVANQVASFDFNNMSAGAVAADSKVWGWNIPSLTRVDAEHGLSLYPSSTVEWNIKSINTFQHCDLIAEMDYYMPAGGVLQGSIVAVGGYTDQDIYLTPSTVETCVYDVDAKNQRGWKIVKHNQSVGWHRLKVIVHMADKTKSIYVDNIPIFERVNISSKAMNYYLLNPKNFYIQRFGLTASGNAYVDNLNLRIVTPTTIITEIKYENGKFLIATEKIVDEATTANAIALLRAGDSAGEPTPVSIQVADSLITVTPSMPLEHSSTYRLVIDQSLQAEGRPLDRDYLYSVTTEQQNPLADGTFRLGRLPLSGVQNLKAGNTVSFDATALHSGNQAVMLMMASYQKQTDGSMLMTGCKVTESSRTDPTISLSLSHSLNEGDYLKVFLWDKDTLSPYSDAYILK